MGKQTRRFFGRSGFERSPGLEVLYFLNMALLLGAAAFLQLPLWFGRRPPFVVHFYTWGLILTGGLFLIALILNARQKSFFSAACTTALVSITVAAIMMPVGIWIRNDTVKMVFLISTLVAGSISVFVSLTGLFGCKALADKLLCFAILFLLTSQIVLPKISENFGKNKLAERILCGTHLKGLSAACQFAASSHKPVWRQKETWCDILHQEWDVELKTFLCPYAPYGPANYAMNENIPADANDLPGDLVLLFESAPGWNRAGSVEDVVTDRHTPAGANIAFADGHVEFVKAEDIPKLQWTANE